MRHVLLARVQEALVTALLEHKTDAIFGFFALRGAPGDICQKRYGIKGRSGPKRGMG